MNNYPLFNIGYAPKKADLRNNEVAWYNTDKLFSKAISMFEWINLPSSIDERYLEIVLATQGHICFFKDEELNVYLALQCTLGGRFNVYNLPTEYRIFTPSGYNTSRDASNSVIIYNNYMHTPTLPKIWYNANRIADIDRTIEVNINQLKRPFIFLVPENKVQSVKALFRKIKDNEEIIIGASELELENLGIQNTITPNNTLELYALKKKYYNEALGDLGISNFSDDKKERLLAGEITSNEEEVALTRLSYLNARKQACKEINEMFGLNIDVKFRYEAEEEEYVKDTNRNEEGDEGNE